MDMHFDHEQLPPDEDEQQSQGFMFWLSLTFLIVAVTLIAWRYMD